MKQTVNNNLPKISIKNRPLKNINKKQKENNLKN